jgi:sugar/nucleoside kinase (ribokinase family)
MMNENQSTLSPKTPLDAVVAGYLGVDIASGFPLARSALSTADFFRPGRLIETEGLAFSLGGVVANTGLAMKKFGQNVEVMGCVGRDALGDIVEEKFRQEGVTLGIARKADSGTAYGIVIAPPGRDRIFFEDSGCNAVFGPDDIDYSTVARSRLFHLGYPPLMKNLWDFQGAQLVAILRRVRSLGVATSLDMALPDADSPSGKADWQQILANVLPHVDIFVPSLEEIVSMLEPREYAALLHQSAEEDVGNLALQALLDRLAMRILDWGVPVLMIKCGSRGAYLCTGDISKLNATTPLALPIEKGSHRKWWVDCLPYDSTRFRNACGAGDCAVAGFLTALLKGESIEVAADYAMAAGRDNLYGVDALSGLTAWDTMTACIARNKEKKTIKI